MAMSSLSWVPASGQVAKFAFSPSRPSALPPAYPPARPSARPPIRPGPQSVRPSQCPSASTFSATHGPGMNFDISMFMRCVDTGLGLTRVACASAFRSVKHISTFRKPITLKSTMYSF